MGDVGTAILFFIGLFLFLLLFAQLAIRAVVAVFVLCWAGPSAVLVAVCVRDATEVSQSTFSIFFFCNF